MAYQNTFSKSVEYNGIIFDSILEAKFAMLIEDSCDYYYHPFTIWYDKKDPTKLGKQCCSNQYQPDFLVRKLSDNTCHLIEIKSSSDRLHGDTLTKLDRAEQYIKTKGHNWKYKVITEKDFKLPANKIDKLNKARKTRVAVARKKKSSRIHNKLSMHKMNYRSIHIPFERHNKFLTNAQYLHYIKTGIKPDKTLNEDNFTSLLP